MKLSATEHTRLVSLLDRTDLSHEEEVELRSLVDQAMLQPSTVAALAAETAPAPAPEPAAPREPGLLDNARAAISAKAALLRENGGLKASLGEMRAALADAEAQLATLSHTLGETQTDLAALVDERALLQTTLDEARAQEKSVTAATIDALASLGVPAASLPAPDSSGGQDPREALLEEFRRETNPGLRHELFRQIRALDAQRAAQPQN